MNEVIFCRKQYTSREYDYLYNNMIHWCNDQFGKPYVLDTNEYRANTRGIDAMKSSSGMWTSYFVFMEKQDIFLFKNPNDAILFKLTWGGR